MGGLPRPAGARAARLSPVWIERLQDAPPGGDAAVVWRLRAGSAPALAALAAPAATPQDEAHAARRRDPARRAATLDRRRLLRALAARVSGVDPAAVEIVQAPQGGPALAAPSRLRLSVAARDDRIVLAASLRAVGVDVERIEPQPHRPLDLLHPQLARRLAGVDHRAFTAAWSGVEAYLKLLGIGLEGLARVTVDGDRAAWPGSDHPPARLLWRFDARHVHTLAVPV